MVFIVLIFAVFWLLQNKPVSQPVVKTTEDVFGVWTGVGFGFNPLLDEFDMNSFSGQQAVSAKSSFFEMKNNVSNGGDFAEKSAIVELISINEIVADQLLVGKEIETQRSQFGNIASNETAMCSNIPFLEKYKTNLDSLLQLSNQRNQSITAFSGKYPELSRKISIDKGKIRVTQIEGSIENTVKVLQDVNFACSFRSG